MWSVVAALFATLSSATPTSAQTGPVAAFGFNEGTGSTTADASGNANTGTVSGATWTASGKFGGALSFDGTNDWVTVADSSSLDLTNGMTVEAWVYASSVANWRSVVLKEGTSGLSYALYASDTSSRSAGFIRRTSDIDATGTSATPTNSWVHLATTYNGTTLTLFVNGTQVATRAITGSIVTSSQPLRVGGNAPWGEFFAGRIDEVRIYNRALSAGEIQTDMVTPVGQATAPVPDFSVGVSPATQAAVQGAAASYTVAVTPANGFSGPVSFSASGLPAGATATYSPASVTGSGSTTLTISTAATTPPGSSSIVIAATSGALTRTTAATLTATAAPVPSFTISALPSTRSLAPGQATSYGVTVAAQNGFSSPVDFAVAGLPSGAVASFNPTVVNGAGTTTMTVTTASGTPVGASSLTIQAISGSLNRSLGVTLTVTSPPDFTLSSTPASLSVVQAGTATYTVATGSVGGFGGPISLSVSGLPLGTSAAFSPATVTAGSTSTLTISTSPTTPIATSTLQVLGTSDTLTHDTNVGLTVTAAPSARAIAIDFAGSGTAMNASEAAGVVSQANWNSASGSSRSTAMPLVDSAGTSTSASVTWDASSAAATSISDQPGNRRMMKGHLNTTSSTVSTVNVSGLANATYDIYVYVDGENGGSSRTASYRISGAGISTTTINLTDAANANFSSSFVQASGSTGNYVKFRITASGFTVTGTPSGSSGTRRAPINGVQIVPVVPDFLVAISPGTGTVVQGNSVSYTITATALNGFTGSVQLAVEGLPAGATGAFAPTFISGSGSSTLTVTTANDSPTGTSSFAVTGTAGSLARTATGSLTVNSMPSPDFSLTAFPFNRTITRGGTASYVVSLAAIAGFAGQVTLSAAGLPGDSTAAFTPTSIYGSGTTTMDVTTSASTPVGASTVTITGSDGATTRSTSVLLTVTNPTYSLAGAISPASAGSAATVTLGGTATATTTANGDGTFSFPALADGSYVVSPAKDGFTFSPPSRTVTLNGASMTGVDFAASTAANTIAIASPANGATVGSSFSMSASASASVVAVQFQVDGANVGPEDVNAPFSTSVTAAAGAHSLRAIGRDASGNTVTSVAVNVAVGATTGTTLTIDGAQTFQTMDGMGVNINSLSWKNGELAPALDRLINEVGVKTWRVVFDMLDWESANDNADPQTPDWTYYNALYSNAKFQNLWGTLRYLNQKGITSGILLSFMGRVSPWMGGERITNTTAIEDEWVESVATLLYYAKNTENLQFDLLDPINEPDWDGFEGPKVDAGQYTRLLEKLSRRLDVMGLGSIRFIGPNTAQVSAAVDGYLPQLFANGVVMSKLDHFGLHNYSGQTGGADARIKGSAFPQKNFWMTELSIPEQIFTMIGQGASAVQIWDAYDSVYNHAILAGAYYKDGRGSTPPNDAGNLAALMSYSSSTGMYSARPQFYQMQTFKYVFPGAVRIAATESNSSLTVYAFQHPATGRLTIVGRNISGSSITLKGSLTGTSTTALQLYQTSVSDNYNSFVRGTDAVVTNGAFVATVAPNSYFTLTSGAQ